MSPAPTPMRVAADTGALRYHAGRVELLLIRRKFPPFQGRWALPGGFVEPDEDLPVAAARELLEETGVQAPLLVEVGAFGTPGRDPRHRTVTIVYYTVTAGAEACAADDAADATWHPIDALPDRLAFDHDLVTKRILDRFRRDARLTHVLFAFTQAPFDLRTTTQIARASGIVPVDVADDELTQALRDCAVLVDADSVGFRLASTSFSADLSRPLLW